MKKKKEFLDLENERYGLFLSDQSINLDIEYARDFLKHDNIQNVYIYKINVIETKANTLYAQARAKDKKFAPPVKINCMVNIESGNQSNYGDEKSGIVRDDSGPIKLGVFLKELEEKNLEIQRGDIIQYNMSQKNRFYEVQSVNSVLDTSRTIGGMIEYWKEIIGIPVKSDVVPFIQN